MWKSEFRQNYYQTSFSSTVAPFAARISRVIVDGGTWQLKWECLKAGKSNGKLPPRTCPGCSAPEPYRSHDWALVPAKPGLQGWILMNEWMNEYSITRDLQCKPLLFFAWEIFSTYLSDEFTVQNLISPHNKPKDPHKEHRYRSTLLFNLSARWSTRPRGKMTWHPLYRRLRGPQGPPMGFQPLNPQPITSHYTDQVTTATTEFTTLMLWMVI